MKINNDYIEVFKIKIKKRETEKKRGKKENKTTTASHRNVKFSFDVTSFI